MPRYIVPVKRVRHYITKVELEADDLSEAAEEAVKMVLDEDFTEQFFDTLVVMEKIKEVDAPPSKAQH